MPVTVQAKADGRCARRLRTARARNSPTRHGDVSLASPFTTPRCAEWYSPRSRKRRTTRRASPSLLTAPREIASASLGRRRRRASADVRHASACSCGRGADCRGMAGMPDTVTARIHAERARVEERVRFGGAYTTSRVCVCVHNATTCTWPSTTPRWVWAGRAPP